MKFYPKENLSLSLFCGALVAIISALRRRFFWSVVFEGLLGLFSKILSNSLVIISMVLEIFINTNCSLIIDSKPWIDLPISIFEMN